MYFYHQMLNEKSGINGSNQDKPTINYSCKDFQSYQQTSLIEGWTDRNGSIIDRSDNPGDFTDFTRKTF